MDEVDRMAAAYETPDLITIALEDGGIFYIQRGVLCLISKYFIKALQGPFSESVTNTLTLPGYSTATVKLFLCWLTNPIPSFRNREYASDEERDKVVVDLAQLWMLGDMLDIPRLQNEAIVPFLDVVTTALPLSESVVRAIIPGTERWSPIRECVMRRVVWSWYGDYSMAQKAALADIPGMLEAFAEQVEPRGTMCSSLPVEHYLVPDGTGASFQESTTAQYGASTTPWDTPLVM